MALIVALLGTVSAAAVTCAPGVGRWTGAAGNFLWEDAENWSKDTIPGAAHNVCIPDGKHVILQSRTTVKSLVVGAGSTFSIQGKGCVVEALLEATDSVTIPVDATIVLDSNADCGGADAVLKSPTITNRGTISSQHTGGGGFGRGLWGHLTNHGTININHPTQFDQGGFTNRGALNIASGVVLDINNGNGFLNYTGGVITTGGTGELHVNGGTFEQHDGVVTNGSRVYVIDGGLKFTGAGKGAFTVVGVANASGTMTTAHRMTVLGRGCGEGSLLHVGTAGLVNNGTITLTSTEDCGGTLSSLVIPDQSLLTNRGVIRTAPGGGTRTIVGDVANQGGTLKLGTDTNLASGAGFVSVLTNKGTVTGSGSLYLLGASQFVNGDNGWVASPVVIDNEGRFIQGKGSVFEPVVLVGGKLTFAGNGEGEFVILKQVELAGDLAAGQRLTILGRGCAGESVANAVGGFTNAGTITLGANEDCGGALSSLVLPAGATLTNDGKIFSVDGPGAGDRSIVGNVLNRGSLYTTSAPTAIQGNFTQIAGGSTRIVLTDPTHTPLSIAGNASLGGVLSVEREGDALFGQDHSAVTYATRAGKFSSINGNGTTYFARYDPSALVLVPAPAPVIHGFTPGSGVVGEKIVIEGDGFTSASSVSFPQVGGGRVAAKFTILNDEQIRTTIPAGAASGGVQVKNQVGTTTSETVFRVKPKVAALSPTTGPVGTKVVITGTSFTGVKSVRFGDVQASFTFVNDGKITATVPAGATTARVTVVTPSGSGQSPVDFTVT